MSLSRSVPFAFVALLASCAPPIPEGRIACAVDDDCPGDWVCASDQRCRSHVENDAGDAGDVDASDAGDAGAPCAPTDVDYVEANDSANAPIPAAPATTPAEVTGLAANVAASVDIGGCIDSAFTSGPDGTRDSDAYAFKINGSAQWLVGRFTRSGAPQSTDELHVLIQGPNGFTLVARVTGDSGALSPMLLTPGDYQVWVSDNDDATIARYGYRLELWTVICGGGAPNSTYTESQDGAGNRDNDTYSLTIDQSMANPPVFEPTASATDGPEPSAGLAIGAGQAILVNGNSANVASAGDSFRDRDSFRFLPGAGVSALLATATWSDATQQLAILGIPEGTSNIGTGNTSESSPTASIGLKLTALEPARLWIANGDGPSATGTSYSITVCAVSTTPP